MQTVQFFSKKYVRIVHISTENYTEMLIKNSYLQYIFVQWSKLAKSSVPFIREPRPKEIHYLML